jgi:hypothetical protein
MIFSFLFLWPVCSWNEINMPRPVDQENVVESIPLMGGGSIHPGCPDKREKKDPGGWEKREKKKKTN